MIDELYKKLREEEYKPEDAFKDDAERYKDLRELASKYGLDINDEYYIAWFAASRQGGGKQYIDKVLLRDLLIASAGGFPLPMYINVMLRQAWKFSLADSEVVTQDYILQKLRLGRSVMGAGFEVDFVIHKNKKMAEMLLFRRISPLL